MITQQSRSIAELSQLGWSRDKIAAELGVSTTFIFRTLKMAAEMQRKPVEPPSQLSMMVITVEELYAKQAKERQAEAGGDKKSLVAPAPQAIEDRSRAREQAAKALGIGARSVQPAKTGPGCKQPAHLPSKEEIAAACEQIRSTWSGREELSRRPASEPWTLQQFCWSDLAG